MGRYRGGDAGYYYIRDDLPESRVVWFAEHDPNETDFAALDFDDGFLPRRFANVFLGTRRTDRSFEGNYFDVPKGMARWRGTLTVTPAAGRLAIRGAYETMLQPEDGAAWADFHSGHAATQPRFQGTGTGDLTGTWLCDDGGAYYVRHVGNRVVWYGENGDRRFANVFDGLLTGTILNGRWADVPKFPGGTRGHGRLTLQVSPLPTAARPPIRILSQAASMTATGRTGGFGGTSWGKVDFSQVIAGIHTFEIRRAQESSGDEPYLWTVWLKADGDTIDILELEDAELGLGPHSGHQNNLTRREDLPTGTRLPVPGSFGRFHTRLRTFRNLNPTFGEIRGSDFATLMLFVAAWEEDAASAGVARGLYNDVRRIVLAQANDQLRRALNTTSVPTTESITAAIQTALVNEIPVLVTRAMARVARSLNVGLFFDPDDVLGMDTRVFRLSDLQGRVTPIMFDFGRYRLTGSISAS